MATPAAERERVLRTIEAWPIEDQVTLAQVILGRVAARLSAPKQTPRQGASEGTTWEALHGLAANGRTPPTDEQIEQWLDEHRMEKYGR